MKKEDGFTLIELLITIAILGIVFAIVIPTLSQSNKGIDNKLIYSQFETVYQKAMNDAVAESIATELEFGSEGYKIISPKPNREVKYLEHIRINSSDIGKKIEIDQKGKVISSTQINFTNRNEDILLEINTGYHNVFFNGILLSTLKND